MSPTGKVRLPTDSDWAALIDEEKLTERRRAAEQEYRDLDSETIAHMRRRAKSDLFFLNHALLGWDLMSEDLHGSLCYWLNGTGGMQFRMIVLPRLHYKSTVITEGDSIQKALPDDGRVAKYPGSLGTNIKILLTHETREMASRFLYGIASAFMSKPLMLALFPECIPTKRSQRINKWELDLPRTTDWREPTFDTIGAGGAAQGRHYHHIKMDDLIGEDARDSETVMKRVVNWFDNVNSLLTRPKIDGWDLIGTFWAYNDIYSHALDVYGVNKAISRLTNFFEDQVESIRDGVLAAYGRGIVEDNKIIFPEETSWEQIEILRRNPMVYAAQYANNPRQAGLTEFDPAWLQIYRWRKDDELETDAGEQILLSDLDKVILLDPSMGETKTADESGIVVTGTDRKNRIFVLETVKERLKPPELIEKIFELNAKWQTRTVAIEEVAFSAIYRFWLEDAAKRLKTHVNVTPYKPGSRKKKEARVRGLTPFASAAQIFATEGMHALRDEWEKFPMDPGNIHLLDALAQGPEVWRRGLGRRQLNRYREVEEELLKQRSSTTGY